MEVRVEGNTLDVPAFGYGMDLDDWAWYGILKQEPESEQTVFLVKNNVFNLNHSEYALFLRNYRQWKYPGEIPVLYEISNNLITMKDGYKYSLLSSYTKGAVIRNNRFRGHGDMALYIVNYSENGLVLGNNFSTAQLNSSAYLTKSTKNWTFVGGDLGETATNLGTNNIFTGFNVNQSADPFGQTIRDNLEEMNDAVKVLKSNY